MGGAEGAGVAGVELLILLPRRGEAKFQVLQWLAAPILVDAVGEGLAIAGRAVEIDGDDAIALLGIKARVPARRPAVAEAALRSAVDQESDGQLRRRRLFGLEDHPPHRVAVRSEERRVGKEGVSKYKSRWSP